MQLLSLFVRNVLVLEGILKLISVFVQFVLFIHLNGTCTLYLASYSEHDA